MQTKMYCNFGMYNVIALIMVVVSDYTVSRHGVSVAGDIAGRGN